MKIARILLVLLLIFGVLGRVEMPVTYRSFLSKLSSLRRYQQTSLLDELQVSVPTRMKEEHEMEYEIIRSFVMQYFYRSEITLNDVHKIFEEFFIKFKARWVSNMQDTIIRELGLDTSSEDYLRELRAHPEHYSINYETFKVLTYRV